MIRRVLVAAALAATPLAAATPAEAGPPYCVDVSDSRGTALRVCAVGADCAVYGGGLDQVPVLAFRYCFPWP